MAEENKAIPATTETTVNVNASVNFTLFQNPFVAAFEKKGERILLLLAPSETSGRKATTVEEIIKDIKNMLGSSAGEDELKSLQDDIVGNIGNVTEGGSAGAMGIAITIQQAFLYYEKEGEASKMEYAFSLKIDTSSLLENLNGLFSLNSASISVWKTSRKRVLEMMEIFGIEDFLMEYPEVV